MPLDVKSKMIIMPNPRDILNELKWKKNLDIDLAEIWFVHRGAPDDTKIISGKEIVKLGKSFMIFGFIESCNSTVHIFDCACQDHKAVCLHLWQRNNLITFEKIRSYR